MAIITEDYVSFETAKLLKEKGYKGSFNSYYNNVGYVVDRPNALLKEPEYQYYERVSLYMAMKWLREVHHVEISITFGFPFIDGKQQYKYFWSVVKVCNNHLEYPMDDSNNATYNEEIADSYKKACEAAIKYCLENLI